MIRVEGGEMRQSMIHNMSAPPRSHITIAPHRGNASFVRIKLMGLVSQTREWKAYVLRKTGMNSWEDLEVRVRSVVVDIPPVLVMAKYQPNAKLEVNPIHTVAILSRVIGNLYLQRTEPILSYERLSQHFVVGEPKMIEQLQTQLILHA